MSKVKSFAEIMNEEYAQKLQTIDDEPDQEEKELLLALRLSQQEAEQQNIKLQLENNENDFSEDINNNNNENNKNNEKNDEEELKKAEEDFVYALQLQEEFDKQKEDEDVRYMQVNSRQNNFSKVAISYDRFRSIPSHSLTDPFSDDDYDEEEDENEEENDLNNQEKSGNYRPERSIGINTNKQYGGRVSKEKFTSNNNNINNNININNIKKEITTKHDPLITGKLNAIILDNQLANNFGNLEELNTPISNSIYTSLKSHADKVETRRIRFHGKEDRETREHVMDPRTRILLYKMLNNGLLSEVGGILSTGKEANVYLGLTDNLPNHLILENHFNCGKNGKNDVEEYIGVENPGFYAIKIYKTTLNEFKNRDLYLKYDYRFRFKHNKQNPRKFIAIWAEKERDNLLRLKNIGIVCPEVILLRKHILVLQFIGDRRGVKAPHLKDAITSLSTKEIDQLYKECAIMMRNMYQRAKLVHADLSEYNLLYYQSKLFVIDMAQAVENEHPFALAFLKRDCENINRFFDSAGASFVMSTKELFLFIVTEHFNAMNDVIFGNNKKLRENNDAIISKSENVLVKIDDVSFPEDVKEKKNVKKRKDDVIVLENFWKRLERMAVERGEISDNLKRDDEVFLNGFLPRTLADIDDISLPTSSFISSQYLTENNNDNDEDEDEDEGEFDAEYEVKEWEERPKFSKEEQKLLRKEAKRRYKDTKRAKRLIKTDQPKSDSISNDNDNDNVVDNE